jgi:putative membrane protein
MIADALLAYAHYLTIFALASVLFAELVLLRPRLPADLYRRLRIVDRWYGITAVLVIASGLARLNLGVKGAAFYTHNPIFWTKMGLFVAVGLLSIAPTVAYIRWQKRAEPDGSLALEPVEFARTRGWIYAQLALFALIPLCATLMARGLR